MIEIEIVNWRKHVGRGDLKSVPWVKISSDIVASQTLFGLTPAQKWVWVCIICEAAKQNSDGKIKVSTEFLSHQAGVSVDDINAVLQLLQITGLIGPVHARDTRPLRPRVMKKSSHLPNVSKVEVEVEVEAKAKENKEGKESPSAPVVTDLSDFEIAISRDWLDLALTEHPHRKDSASFTVERFGQDLRKAQRALSLTDQQMTDLFEFVKHSAFWRPNAAVPSGLLNNSKNGLRKIDNIIASMKPQERRESEILNEQIAKGQFKKASNPLDEEILKGLGVL